MIVCPECGTQNRPGANQCLKCGCDLRPRPAPETGEKRSLLQRLAHSLLGTGDPGRGAPARPAAPVAEEAAEAPTPPEAPAAALPLIANRYAVLHEFPLQHSTYYEAIDLVCPVCEQRMDAAALKPDGTGADRCRQCASNIGRLLVHETRGPEPGMPSTALARISRTGERIAAHRRVFQSGECTYAAVELPPGWQSLAQLPAPVTFERAAAWCDDLGAALSSIHARGATWGVDGIEWLESVLLVEEGRAAWLGDLSQCRLLPAGAAKARVQRTRDILFLARALAYMLLHADLTPGSAARAPDPPRRALAGALRGEYEHVEDFLAALREPAPAPAPAPPRWLSQIAAVGPMGVEAAPVEDTRTTTLRFTLRVAHLAVPAGLYILIDGADTAARGTARRALAQPILQVMSSITRQAQVPDLNPGGLLVAGVQAGWQALACRGASLVAVLAIGNQAYAAGSGPGCAHFLRAGQLNRLVAGAAAASAQADAAPATLALQPGDQILLCPQRLCQALDERTLCAILQEAPSLEAACLALAGAAPGAQDAGTVLIRFTPWTS